MKNSTGSLCPQNWSSFFSLDTFASKVAAIQDDCADASVGNVTGSNAVNVFLGIGIAWSLAAIYWAAQGKEFVVPVGRYVVTPGLNFISIQQAAFTPVVLRQSYWGTA